jgi:alanine racemase
MASTTPISYVRVDRSALRHNFGEVIRHLTGRARLMPVLKANAYGHGLVEVARLFAELGSPALGVASVEEGLALREARVLTPITAFQPPLPDQLPLAAGNRLTVTVTQPEHVDALAQWAPDCGYEVAIDVGLGRSGHTGDPEAFLAYAVAHIGRPASGVWTHLGAGMAPERLPERVPDAWPAMGSAAARLRYLDALRGRLAQGALPRPIFHATASAALCDTDCLLWDQVRIGSLLYGAYPPSPRRRPFDLRPTLELRTHIVELRALPAGASVGYGGEFRTRRATRLATVPVGVSHGAALLPESAASVPAAARRAVTRALGRWGRMFRPSLARVGGQWAPVVGRVSLNECTLDVTDIPSAAPGDEVSVPARMTTLSPALPRVYVDSDITRA